MNLIDNIFSNVVDSDIVLGNLTATILIICLNLQISLKTVVSNVPTVLSLDNGDTITNLYDIANTFNYYFASIAQTTKKSIKYSNKHFSDYLSNESISTLFLQPADREEIVNIITSLNSNKASGPNSIPYRISFLLKNEISKQLADLFNLSFMTGIFPSVLKIAKERFKIRL